jgi:hypothetical protein
MYLEVALNYHYATKGLKILSEGASYFHALTFLRNLELLGKKVKSKSLKIAFEIY